MNRVKRVSSMLRLLCAASLLLPVLTSAQDDGEMLMDEYQCYTCHAADQPSIGPSFVAIANRYAGDDSAVDVLAERVIEGSSGQWGAEMMRPHFDMPEADAIELVRYILAHHQSD